MDAMFNIVGTMGSLTNLKFPTSNAGVHGGGDRDGHSGHDHDHRHGQGTSQGHGECTHESHGSLDHSHSHGHEHGSTCGHHRPEQPPDITKGFSSHMDR